MNKPFMFKNKKKPSQEEIQKQVREKTANQWVPIKDIENGIVYRKDNIILGMLRVQPLNMSLFSDKEKRSKVEALAAELKGEEEGFQIFCIGRPVDLNNYIESLQGKSKHETDYIRKKLLKTYIKEVSALASSGDTTERRFYIIFKKPAGQPTAVAELMERMRNFIIKLESVGLVAKICSDDELLDVYSLFAHPVQASFERTEIDYSHFTYLDYE